MSRLVLVPTPIGNLKDITLRAVEVLKSADAILCEDTRITGRLLKHLDINNKMIAYHQANEHRNLDKVIDLIEQSEMVALVSDAGTPGISDPGFLLLRSCIEKQIEVECLPGPTAMIPALVMSGMPCDRFFFEGFLPHKKGRQTRLKFISQLDQTCVLYESPHRLVKCLDQLIEHCGAERYASVSREITKMYEETVRGSLEEIKHHFQEKGVKGEFVIVLSGRTDSN